MVEATRTRIALSGEMLTMAVCVAGSLALAIGHLDRTVELLAQTVEPGPLGRREVRSYRRAATRFVLVAEPFDRAGEPRVSAIYLQ